MSDGAPTLHMVCGKIAAGKSTLAKQLADAPGTILISEDAWLSALYPDQMTTVAEYVRCAAHLRAVLGPHVADMLNAGVSVVLDFPANTLKTRQWMRDILSKTAAGHQMHVLEVSGEVCLTRLRARNASGSHPFAVTDDQFHQVNSHYAVPTPDEGFLIVTHQVDDF